MKRFLKIFLFIIIAAGVAIGSVLTIRAVNNRGAAPVAQWKFDEGSGTSAYDASGNANTGTLTNMDTSAAWVNGEYGTALQFDGSADYVNMGDPASGILDMGTNDFAIEAWVNKDVSSAQRVIHKRNVASPYIGYDLYINANGTVSILLADAGGYTSLTTTQVIDNGKWYHLVGVFDRDGNGSIYINGVLSKVESIATRSGDISNTGSFFVGVYGNAVTKITYFNGLIDDVRIYNYARTAEQIKNDYNAGKALYVGVKAPASCDVSPADCVNKGLVGYWDMDQMGGTTATDKSGNGNTGTLTSGPVWTNGVQPFSGGRPGGGALKFDGTDDYVSASAISGLTSVHTTSVWIKPTELTVTKNYYIIDKGTNNNILQLYDGDADSKLELRFYDGTVLSGPEITVPNIWYHIVATIDSSKIAKIYLNGTLIVSGGVSGLTPAAISIGKYGDSSDYNFNGLIDDVRIYNRELSAAEIQYQYNQAKPIVYWKFDEGSASSTYDSSGQGNTGTLYGGVQWANGVYGSALQFDGSDDYVKTATNFSNAANAPITLSAWINSNVITNDGAYSRRIILPGGNQYFSLTLSSGKLTAYYYNGSQLELSDSVAVSTGVWYHVVGAYDGTTMRLYVNGILKNSVVTTLSAITSGPIRIGIYSDDTNGKWNGLIDDVRIYNYARSADQVRADYNDGKAMYVGTRITDCDESPADCVNKGLVGYWDMDQMGGTTATDKSGNGNTGTLTSGPVWTNGIQPFSGGRAGGGALNFDGTDDYVASANNVGLSGDFTATISAWVKFNSLNNSGYHTIVAFGATGVTQGFAISQATPDSSQIRVAFFGGVDYGGYTATGAVTTGQWYHLVATKTAGAIGASTTKLYINGVSQSLTFGSSATPNMVDGKLYVGSDAASEYSNSAIIDDVRIYNRALSASEIRYQYNQAKPIAWWKMDSVGVSGAPGAALNVYDNSGQGNTGVSSGETMNNGTITGATVKSGSNCKYGSCLSFDASSDYVDGTLSLGTAYSVEAWVKIDSTYPASNGRYLICFGAAGGLPCVSPHYYDGNKPLIYLGGSNYMYGTTNLNDNAWHHIVFVVTGSGQNDIDNANIYIDGTADVGSTYKVGLPSTPAGVFRIGAGNYKGYIDNVRVYNVALTESQALALYQNNDRAAGASLEANLVGEWRFDENAVSYVADTHYQREGKYGYAMNFDGTDDYVATNGVYNFATGYTLGFWFQESDKALGGFMTSGWLNGISFWGGSGQMHFITGDGVNYGAISITYGGDKKWHHLVVVRNGEQINAYVDGKLSTTAGYYPASVTISGLGTVTISNLRIGYGYGMGDPNDTFKGLIDDVRIYNYALNATQIKTLYNENSAVRFGPESGLP